MRHAAIGLGLCAWIGGPATAWAGGRAGQGPPAWAAADGRDEDSDDGEDDADDADDDEDSDDEDSDDEGEGAVVAGPCSGGGWGAIGVPGADWQHVSALLGSDLWGDGTVDHPYATVARAVEAARVLPTGVARVVAVWPGAYDASVSLQPGVGWDDPVSLLGCAPDETALIAADPTLPVVETAVVPATTVQGLSLVGGTRSLAASAGATLWADGVWVQGATRTGVWIAGDTTTAVLRRTVVAHVAEDGGCGWGAASWGADTTWDESAVIGAVGAGIVAEGGVLDVRRTLVTGIAPTSAGLGGRGVHAQYAALWLEDAVVADTWDAGVFALSPTGGRVRNIVIDLTGAGWVAGSPTGDGVVVTGARRGAFPVQGTVSLDVARAAVLFEEANVDLSGNTAIGAGAVATYGSENLAQGAYKVSGADAASVVGLPAGSLAVDLTPLVCP